MNVRWRLRLFPLFLAIIFIIIYSIFSNENNKALARLDQNETLTKIQIKFLNAGQLFYQNGRSTEAYKEFIDTLNEVVGDLRKLQTTFFTEESLSMSNDVISSLESYIKALQETMQTRIKTDQIRVMALKVWTSMHNEILPYAKRLQTNSIRFHIG